jgi:hypothetical protein
MSSGCATQSTRWKDSSGRAGNVMLAILPELFPAGDGQAGRIRLRQHEPIFAGWRLTLAT